MLQEVVHGEPAFVLVDGSLDVVSVDIVEQAVYGGGTGRVAIEARDDVVDEGRVILWGRKKEFACSARKVFVELSV